MGQWRALSPAERTQTVEDGLKKVLQGERKRLDPLAAKEGLKVGVGLRLADERQRCAFRRMRTRS